MYEAPISLPNSDSSEEDCADDEIASNPLILDTEETRANMLTRGVSLEGLSCVNRDSVDGLASHIYDKTPEAKELIQRTEESGLTSKETSSSLLCVSELESVELSAELEAGVNPEYISYVLEEGPLEGTLLCSSSSEETPAHITGKVRYSYVLLLSH